MYLLSNTKKNKYIFVFLLLITYLFLNIYTNISIPCIFHEITGLYCPGCGITRMITSLVKLDFYKAFRYNQLLFVVSPIIALLVLEYIYSIIKKKTPLTKKIPDYILYISIVILILFAILRNIFPYFAPINDL